ncbi:MAG: vanadium-dependent haloperoxidase [Pirellulales bacterium]|nr:vanadium-dependent haloperoxidase [Pirellulales bacterium]
MSHRVLTCLAGLVLCLPSQVFAADVVTAWNALLAQGIRNDTTMVNPGWSSRALALMNGAMYDSLMAIERTHVPFLVDTSAGDPSSVHAALATAAHDIALAVYPGQQALFDNAYNAQMAAIAASPKKVNGIALGQFIANEYLAARAMDGSDVMAAYGQNPDPGHWRPDPLHSDQQAWGPGWGAVDPFTYATHNDFPAVPVVPDMTSAEYTASFDEVKSLGEKNSMTRTADQTEIGIFWGYDRQGMGPPPVLYTRNLLEISEQQGNSLQENALLFAQGAVAMADAAIAAWDVKYRDDFWRPISGIREADTDGNPLTVADESWEPLGAPSSDPFTPPFPAYVSGHATFGGALYSVLESFYGTDNVSFDLTSQELPGVTRHFTSFSQAELENAESRIFLGIHWRFDAVEGINLGNNVAAHVTGTYFQPVPEPSSFVLALAAIALGGCHWAARRRTGKRS